MDNFVGNTVYMLITTVKRSIKIHLRERYYSKFGLRKMVLNTTCKMPDRTAFLLITADAPAFKQAYFEPILL